MEGSSVAVTVDGGLRWPESPTRLRAPAPRQSRPSRAVGERLRDIVGRCDAVDM